MNETKVLKMPKLQVLGFVKEQEVVTSSNLAERFNADEKAAGMVLLRLARQGLLKAYRAERPYAYKITDRGIERFNFLERLTSKLAKVTS